MSIYFHIQHLILNKVHNAQAHTGTYYNAMSSRRRRVDAVLVLRDKSQVFGLSFAANNYRLY